MAPRKRRLAGPIRPGETPAQFKARIAAMDRAFTKPPRKPKNAKVIIESPVVSTKALALRKSYDKETTALRNVAVKIVSDFISEELVGFGKKLTRRQEAAFRTPKAAPDAVVDRDEFQRTTGIRISQSEVLKDQQTAFFETKVKGTGSSSEPEITSISLGKTSLPTQFGEVQRILSKTGKLNITGDDAVDVIFTDTFKAQRETLFIQAKQKFENFLLFQVTDADKKPTQELLFAPNPLHGVQFSKEYVKKYFDIRFRGSSKRVGRF